MRHVENEKFMIKNARGAYAIGMSTSDGFVVLKGSKVAESVTASFPATLANMREKLMRDGVIDDRYTFTCDNMFSSPSTAAAIVIGGSANGRREWKNSNNQTLAFVETMQNKE